MIFACAPKVDKLAATWVFQAQEGNSNLDDLVRDNLPLHVKL